MRHPTSIATTTVGSSTYALVTSGSSASSATLSGQSGKSKVLTYDDGMYLFTTYCSTNGSGEIEAGTFSSMPSSVPLLRYPGVVGIANVIDHYHGYHIFKHP